MDKTEQRKIIDCGRVLGEVGCTLTIAGSAGEVVDAVLGHAIGRHGYRDDPLLRAQIRAGLRDSAPPVGQASRRVTGRQRELLGLVAAGQDNIAIARQLGLSPGTVRKHLENAFARLGVSSRTAAIAKLYPEIAWL